MKKLYTIRLLLLQTITLIVCFIVSLPSTLAAEPLFSPYPGSKLNKTSIIAGESNKILERYHAGFAKDKNEIFYLTRIDNIPQKTWGTISISLLNGDNGIVLLKISPVISASQTAAD